MNPLTLPTAPSPSQTLFVVPRGEGAGFRAKVRGHVLDLIDPSSYALAPTADDLLVVSLAATSAWVARNFLRERNLPDYVSVSAERRTQPDPSGRWEVKLTITVSEGVRADADALAAALQTSLTARLAAEPAIHISFQEG